MAESTGASALLDVDPNFCRMTVESVDSAYKKRTVIYSTLDELIVGQTVYNDKNVTQIPNDTDLTVQALNLTLIGKISIPRGDVRLYCKKLVILPDVGASIDVSAYLDPLYTLSKTVAEIPSGGNPPIGGKSGETMAQTLGQLWGQKGDAGGSIRILCQELELNGQLFLTANGGQGYAGCDGQQGGDSTDPSQPGGPGGDGQQGGEGGDGGFILVEYQNITQLGKDGSEEVVPGDLSHLIHGAKGGSEGTPGNPGIGGQKAGSNGNYPLPSSSGENGEYICKRYADSAHFGQSCDDIFMLKIIQKAKMMYLRNQPESYLEGAIVSSKEWSIIWDSMGELMTWIQGCLSSYALIKPDASLSEKRKNNLYAIISKYVTYHITPLNYFGGPPNQVPTMVLDKIEKEAILKKYLTSYDDLLSSSNNIRDIYLSYVKKINTDIYKAADRSDYTAQLKYISEEYLKEYKDKQEKLKDPTGIKHTVEITVAHVMAQQNTLQTLLGDMQVKIKDHEDWNVKDILESLSMFAFTGGEGMPALMMGGITGYQIYDGVINKISNNDGKSYEKSDIIKSIVSFQKKDLTLQDVRESLFSAKDGVIKLTDQGKYILAEIDQFEDLITEFSSALGESFTAEVAHALESYKAAIFEKGKAQLTYTSHVLSMADSYQKYQDAQDELTKISKDKNSEIDIPSELNLASHYAMLYQESLDRIVDFMAQLRREYAYCTMNISGQEGGADISKLLTDLWDKTTPINSTTDLLTLSTEISHIVDEFVTYYSEALSPKYHVPGTLFSFSIEEKPVIDSLIDSKMLTIRIIPAGQMKKYKSAKITHKYSDKLPRDKRGNLLYESPETENWWGIRVLKVQPRIYGIMGTRGHSGRLPSVEIKINSTTEKGIMNESGEMFLFAHDKPRQGMFAHRVDTKEDSNDNSDIVEGIDGHLNDEYLDALGLFGCWDISFAKGENSGDINYGIKLNTIKKITFYFESIAHPRATLHGRS